MFTTYRDETMADECTVLKTMKVMWATGGMVVIHCEADHIIEETQRRIRPIFAVLVGSSYTSIEWV